MRASELEHQLPPGVVLRSDEHVLWKGRPFQGLMAFRGIDAFLVPFSLVWAGFALFWNITVWTMESPLFFKLWGLPFLIAGAYVTVGRLIHNKVSRSKAFYVLTNQRAIVVMGNGKRIREHALASLQGIETSARADGSGTITFAPSNVNLLTASANPKAALAFWGGPGVDGGAFYRIEDVQHVTTLVQNAMY